jgi:hypothetical protein
MTRRPSSNPRSPSEVARAAAERTEPARSAATLLSRAALGRRLAGFIYGTIVVLSVIVAGARAFADDPGELVGVVVATSTIFWLAHVYAHALGDSLAGQARLTLAEVRQIARRELSIVEAALPPVAALSLGAVGVLSTQTALWCAVGLGLAVLGAQGLVFARLERLGWAGTLAVVTTNVAFGLLLAALKVVVSH